MTTYKDSLFCFIPAKAASTRLKKKNILKLDGKELIYYPISNAISSGLFKAEDVILSTESFEIKKIAESYGAHVPYLREEKLARDPYGVVDVLLDFLEKFPSYGSYQDICILLPTAPLMISSDVVEAYQVYKSSAFDVLMSVTPNEHSAYRSIGMNTEGKISPLFEKHINKKSQELEKTYRINGALIFINVAMLIKEKTYFLKNWGGYEMPAERSVDIDDEAGLRYARYLKKGG